MTEPQGGASPGAGADPKAEQAKDDPVVGPGGVVLRQYVLLEKLSDSRTGSVFKAKHRLMGRTVAIKFLSPEAVASPSYTARFERAIRILSRLQHPNVVQVYELGQQGDAHYVVMEYIDGKDLRTLVNERGPMPVEHAVRCLIQAAMGLARAHQQGVVHRNVKPDNLLVDRQGVVKVVGFTLAHVESGGAAAEAGIAANLTRQGQVVGTYEFMSPEQALDSSCVDRRADVYGLGCTLHMLLSGHPPYASKPGTAQILAHRAQPIPSLCLARSDVSPALDGIFRKMMAKAPEDRYASMQELAAELEATLAAPVPESQPAVSQGPQSVVPTRPAGPRLPAAGALSVPAKRPVRRRLPMAPIVAGGVLLVLAAVFAAQHFRDKRPPEAAKPAAPLESPEKAVLPPPAGEKKEDNKDDARTVEPPAEPATTPKPPPDAFAGQLAAARAGVEKADSWPKKATVLAELSQEARTPAQHRAAAEQTLLVTQKAVQARQFDTAARLGELATVEAGKAREPKLFVRAHVAARESKNLLARSRQYEAAKAALRKNPADAEANLAAGRYECLVQGDWNSGLRKLALSSDTPLGDMAKKDLANPGNVNAQAAVGDGWRKLADDEAGADQAAFRRRAAWWYKKALHQAQGSLKASLEERLRST